MRLDSLRRHAALSTAIGLALAALVSCGTAAPTGPAATATVPAGAVRLPLAERVAAGLARIRDAAKDNPPGEQWAHYIDESGTIWYFWPLPDGRSCNGRGFTLGDQDIRETGCTDHPLPGDGTPSAHVLDGPASVHGGRWVVFLYADQEEIQQVFCGGQQLTARRFGRFDSPEGPRTVYAVSTPWFTVGSLHTVVRRPDGSTADAELPVADGGPGPLVSYAHACA
ncbi:hypothetical protein ACIRD3_13130 [Kitasatospora sp. NPDC093550]|uniref:hypothetical protein n=1 Tax=Kitasatospora sp. NPDC093550 TaxID=3364089 RepID=UPI0038156183